MSTLTLELPAPAASTARWSAVAFVASYSSSGTRQAYSPQLRLWFAWCERHRLEPLTDVCRPHVELYADLGGSWSKRPCPAATTTCWHACSP